MFHRYLIMKGDDRADTLVQCYLSFFSLSKIIELAKPVNKDRFASIVTPPQCPDILALAGGVKATREKVSLAQLCPSAGLSEPHRISQVLVLQRAMGFCSFICVPLVIQANIDETTSNTVLIPSSPPLQQGALLIPVFVNLFGVNVYVCCRCFTLRQCQSRKTISLASRGTEK